MVGEPQAYSDKEVLDMLRRCEEKHGVITARIFDDDDEFCSASYVAKRFGSWNAAKEEAGVDEDTESVDKKYSDEEILEQLQDVADWDKDGKVTTDRLLAYNKEYPEKEVVAPSVVSDRFGSWSKAKDEAGLVSDEREKNGRPRLYTDEDFLEMIRMCKDHYGKVTQRMFDDNSDGLEYKPTYGDESQPFPSVAAIRKRFGSWSKAKEMAGIDDEDTETYSDEELLEMLRECKRRNGKATANVFASEEDFCSPETIQRRFGSWCDGKKLAGVCEI